jgi:glycosyltransferase involved in cell wall biosynthesis
VVTIHDVYQLAHLQELTLIKKIYVKVMTFFAVKLSASIVTVSKFSRNEILRLTNADSKKLSVVYNAVNEKFSTDVEPRQSDEKYILFVGNIKPHKNLINALIAFRLFLQKNDNYKFYIIGKKEGFITGINNLDTLIKGIEKRVVFTGYISDHELKGYYSNASLFFFPSKYEGFGLPILEAMKFYIPILSSNAASLPEVGGDAILYCDSNDVYDMAEKLESVLDNKITFSRIKYDNQLKKFSWANSSNKYTALFGELCEKNHI